jgi:hypothetical protein
MKFGVIKSKIEGLLNESYTKNTFKTEIKNFDKYVLKNKNIAKLFYLYDELSSNKGLNESMVDEYIFESITTYENIINKIKPSDLNELKSWIKNVKSENIYESIDNLFSKDVHNIENRLFSKKIIKESLIKTPGNNTEVIDIPLNSMINIANRTIDNFVKGLSESEINELKTILTISDNVLKEKFEPIKNEVLTKLNTIKESTTDQPTIDTINETIKKINTESYNKLGYYRLKDLNSNL